MALLDTSVIVAYLAGEPAAQDTAAELIDSHEDFSIPAVALAEAAFALTRLYGLDRPRVVDILIDLIGRTNISIYDLPKSLAIEALILCRPSNRVSFADALIWAAARNSGDRRIHTFDRRFPDAEIDRRVLR